MKTIQHLLGHANINVTADTYAHVRLRLQHDAINKLGDTIRQTGPHHDEPRALPDNGYPTHGGWDDDEPPTAALAPIQ